MRRKILFISSDFPPFAEGAGIGYERICRNAAHDVVILAPGRGPATKGRWPGATEEGACRPCRVHRIPYPAPPGGGLADPWFSVLLARLRALVAIAALVVRHRVHQVCIGDMIAHGWMARPIRLGLRRRVIVFAPPESLAPRHEGVLRSVLPHASTILAVSRSDTGVIASTFGVDPRKIRCVPPGVDLDVFRPGPSAGGDLPPAIRDKTIVLAVAPLVAGRGHDTLIAAMPLILGQIPDAHCLIVGAGPLRDHLRRLAIGLGIEANVSLLPPPSRDRVASLYRCAAVFALPCHHGPDGGGGGAGLVFLEANACGLPVVAGVTGASVEAVIDGQTGLLVDGRDPGDVAQAVIRVLSDRRLAHRLGQAGQARARTMTWARSTLDFLRAVDGCDAPRTAASYPTPSPETAVAPAGGTLGPRLLVTVDVEEEFDWSVIACARHTIRGVEGLTLFHRECRAIGVSPVYLATYAMIGDPAYGSFLRQVQAEGSAEVGIHLHSWLTPPHWEIINDFNSYQINLPRHVEYAKLKALCRAFEQGFGVAPSLHRAGRWGGGSRTSDLLESLGLRVDLSPSAGFANACVDFRNLDGSAFWAGPNRTVLVLPASGLRHVSGPDWLSTAVLSGLERYPRMIGTVAAHLPISKLVRFSADGQTIHILTHMARLLRLRNVKTVIYTLHSTSLYAGGNPYAPDAAAAAALLRRNIEILRYCIETLAMRPSTCAAIYAEAHAVRPEGGADPR